MDQYNWSLRGKNSTSIIFLLFVFSSIIIFICDKLIYRFKRFYFYFLICIFSAFSFIYLFVVLIPENNRNVYLDNDKYRLELVARGFLAPAKFPDLFVKHGIFEKRYITHEEYLRKEYLDSAKIIEKGSFYEIKLFHNDTTNSRVSPIIEKMSK